MSIEWRKIKDQKPAIGEPVWICFEPGNPWSCTVGEMDTTASSKCYIWRFAIDHFQAITEDDYWAPIRKEDIPSPW